MDDASSQPTESSLIEEREEVMLTDKGPSLRKTHFLKPFVTSIDCSGVAELPHQCLSVSSTELNRLSSPHSFSGFWVAERHFVSWLGKMEALHGPIWKKAGIFEAIKASTYSITKNLSLILSVAEKWCPKTKSFVFPWGEATITLGFSVLGSSAFAPLEMSEMRDSVENLEKEWRRMMNMSSKGSGVTQASWISSFLGRGDDTEHEAFLVLWLSLFVFPYRPRRFVSRDVISLAVRLARGERIALAPAVLASVYRDLDLISGLGGEKCEKKVTLKSLFKLVQVWTWERFKKTRPNAREIPKGEPRIAQWDTLQQRSNLRFSFDAEDFDWRPYTKPLKKGAREEDDDDESCTDDEDDNMTVAERIRSRKKYSDAEKSRGDASMSLGERRRKFQVVDSDDDDDSRPCPKLASRVMQTASKAQKTRTVCDDVNGNTEEKESVIDAGTKESEFWLHGDGEKQRCRQVNKEEDIDERSEESKLAAKEIGLKLEERILKVNKTWPVIRLAILFLLFALPRVLSVGEDFTSLSCGSTASTRYTDKVTGIKYVSDAPYIDTGDGRQIKPIYQSKVDEKQWLQVCLVKTGDSTPFITTLELRKLNSKAYKDRRGSLHTVIRADVGSLSSNQSSRYRGDVYDRIWRPYTPDNWTSISTNRSVRINNPFWPAEMAMITASFPTDPDSPMTIRLGSEDHSPSALYLVMHFSEIQQLRKNETREFAIKYNGRLIRPPFRPPSLIAMSYYFDEEYGLNANGEYIFSLEKTKNSTLPPLLNAIEVFLVKKLPQQETGTKEVDAMLEIKLRYGLNKTNWVGDPCAPERYRWSGINCSYISNLPPEIISLNLTAHGLTGEILDSISNLTSLQSLDLSSNMLIGSVPEYITNMESLKFINLSSNKLNGSIPPRLLDKMKRGLVSLSIDGNPRLCSHASCAPKAPNKTNKHKTITIVASVVSSVILILAIAGATFVILRRKRKRSAKLVRHPSSDGINLQQSSSPENANNMFTFQDLARATSNFSSDNLIGQGGFGYVHKGTLADGTEVAVKQLKTGSRQGEGEFRVEIETISRVHHRHLISLLGSCSTGSQRFLVYEFVPNKTLEFHLHESMGPVMEWENRMKIALGSAKGLCYLHDDCNPKTIHRDVKSSNILIDHGYEAKLADFGLAKSCSDNETHVSTRVMGTCGYLAPEYAASGKLTEKSDVFSYGVVLLELLTGREPVDKTQPFSDYNDSIVDWAKPLMAKALNDGNFEGLVDPRLEDDFDVSEMTRMVACAAASVQHSAKRRPTMSQIVRVLEGSISLDDLTQGAASGDIATTSYSLDEGSDYCSTQYRQDLEKFKELAFDESQTFGSGESTTTSNNGKKPSRSSSIT
ncbi:unnamed protein product [Microthlaspi erraticum]|uniref:non-specific serine/threonine protein kinase n=1 Tax=Microthlaspi erraticum TaxID=1685480 RepID=A0A6D2KLE3_9BRAS|nr:unnamed protein product [Microthlaspi erraticum]